MQAGNWELVNQAVFDSLPVQVAVLNVGGDIVAVNRVWRQFALENGGQPEEVGIGANYLAVTERAAEAGDVVAAETLAGIKAVLLGQLSHFSLEYPCHSPQEKRWFLLNAAPLADGSGVVITHTNITEQKLAEESLYESEVRFQLTADSAPVLIWMSGVDKLCTYFNQVWLEFTGRTMAQELGYGWAEGVHPDDVARCLTTYTSAFDAHLPFSMEYRLRRADGQYRWILDNGVPLYGGSGDFTGYIGSCIDIGDQRQALLSVAEREMLLRSIVETVDEGIVVLNDQGIIESFNPAASQLFGYPAEEVIGRNASILMAPSESERGDQYLAEFLTTGIKKYIGVVQEAEGQRRDGSVFPMDVVVSEMRVNDQVKFTALVRNISHRRQDELARQQLLTAERQSRLQAETLTRVTLALAAQTSLMAVLDEILTQAHQLVPYQTGNFTMLSGDQMHVTRQRGYTPLGLDASVMRGLQLYLSNLPIDEMVVGLRRPLVIMDTSQEPSWHVVPHLEWVRACLIMPIIHQRKVLGLLILDSNQANAFSYEDAERLQPLANAAAVALENARLYDQALHENVAHEQTSAALRASMEQIEQAKQEWETTVDALPQLICLIGKNHMIARINRAVEQWQLGSPQTAVGKGFHQLLHPDCTNRDCFIHRFYREAWQQLEQGLPFDYAGHDPVLNRYLSLQCRPVPQQSSRIYATILVDDLSERKEMEEAMLHSQKLESLGVMAGGVAHDFNNLLTGILAEASLVLDKLPADHPVQQNLVRLSQTAERAAGLTTQLLAYAGRGRFEVVPLDLNQLVNDNMVLLATTVSKEISLQTALHPGLPLIEADAGQIQQVIMNLIINAAESYEGQPGVVRVATSLEPVLPAGQSQPAMMVCLLVEDKGSGMPAEVQQQIFDPFFTTKRTGRGLGLAAIQAIVQGYQGTIQITSQVGEGTTFRVCLPMLARTDALPKMSAPIPAEVDLDLVLVIDDDRAIRAALTEMLELRGATVLPAENGRKGISLFQQHLNEIQLVLLDMTMPVISGEETFHRLRQLRADIPIILLSGYSEEEAVNRLGTSSVTTFLKKPFNFNQLTARIAESLSEHQKNNKR